MIRKNKLIRAVAGVAAACMLCVSLAACGSSQAERKTPAELNRTYMASVNSISAEASDALASFNDAVSNGDIAAMRLAASDASKKLAKISELEAPEPLAQVHEEYKAGVDDLTTALSQYIEAYATLQNAMDANTTTTTQTTTKSGTTTQTTTTDVDEETAQAEFATQMEEIQARYTSGIEHLSKADSMVAELAGSDGSSDTQSAESGQNS